MLVTCVCPTADRPTFTAEAIGHFVRQSYPACNLRLLVFDTSLTCFVSPLTPAETDGATGPDGLCRIVRRWEPRHPDDTIGAIRNRANSLALTLWPNTDLLAHWDSDDYYSPDRISTQVSQIAESGKSVVGFARAKFTDGVTWWRYEGTIAYALGASLVYRPGYWVSHPFPSKQIGEDSDWTRTSWNENQLLRTDACFDPLPRYTPADMLVVRCHAGNTSPKVPASNWHLLQESQD